MTAGSTTALNAASTDQVRHDAEAELAAITDDASAERFRIKYLGKKGIVRELLKSLKDVPEAERKSAGERINTLRALLEEAFERGAWKSGAAAPQDGFFDHTLPGYPFPRGSLHPLMKIRSEIRDIFTSLGFAIAYGPGVGVGDHPG